MGSEDSRDMEDEGARGARQDAGGVEVPLSGDTYGGRGQGWGVWFGSQWGKVLEGHSSDDSSNWPQALRLSAVLLCIAVGRQKDPGWSLTQEMPSVDSPSLYCLPTDNSWGVKPLTDTGRQETLVLVPVLPLMAWYPPGKNICFFWASSFPNYVQISHGGFVGHRLDDRYASTM